MKGRLLLPIVLLTLTAGAAAAQDEVSSSAAVAAESGPAVVVDSGTTTFSDSHLRLEVQQLLPSLSSQSAPARSFAVVHSDQKAPSPLLSLDPLIQPLLAMLPPGLIPELIRTEERLSFQVDNYTVKPKVDLHSVAIVVTRQLAP